MKKLQMIQVNTTAWDEEDFFLLTDLTEAQISEVIQPIVEESRANEVEFEENEDAYTNEDLFQALKKQYPKATIHFFTPADIDLLSI